jgi:tol-pal system protein YbgF
MTKSSWRCCKKALLALRVAITIVVMLGGAGAVPAFAREPAQTQYDKAMAQYERGDYGQAMATFEQFLLQFPASALADDAQYVLGQCYVQLERHDDAIFAFYTAAYKPPRSNRADDALMALADVLCLQDYMPQAVETYEQLVKTYPQSKHAAYAQTCIGWLYGGMGDTEKATAELKKVAANYPDSPYVETARESLKKLNETAPAGKVRKPIVTLRCNTGEPVEGRPVEFSATVSDQGAQDGLTYQWYLDGQPVGWTGFSPKWQDPKPGTHNVTIMVFDGKEKVGKVVAFTVEAAVTRPPPPVSSIIDQILLLDNIPPSLWNQKNVFSPGDIIYVWVESKILNTPHKLEIVWISPSGKKIKREKFDLRGWGAKETFWSDLQTGRQMMQGQWDIDLLIDGRGERSVSFILKP